jgi:hypothetical protein
VQEVTTSVYDKSSPLSERDQIRPRLNPGIGFPGLRFDQFCASLDNSEFNSKKETMVSWATV